MILAATAREAIEATNQAIKQLELCIKFDKDQAATPVAHRMS